MKLEQSFDVQAPIDVVWRALNDLERVAPCLPGATITGHDDDGTYHGEFKVKLGPTTAAYRGTIKITESDEATHTATLSAKGTDKRGQGGATATIVNRVADEDGVTRVHADTDFTITGRLARFGRGGMIEDISNKLLQNFATCLATRLAEGHEVAAGETAPEATAPPVTTPAEATGAEVAAGDAAPEEIAAPAPAAPAGATGGDVAAGEAAPEAATSVPPPAAAAEPASAAAASRPAAPPAEAEPLKVGGLFWSVLWERIKRFFGGGRKR